MNIFGSLHYNAIGPVLTKEFGKRVVKLSLDGGFTCPNRDGSAGTGGCIFCSSSGSGDFTGPLSLQIGQLKRKWPDSLYLPYFQSHTGTYAPVPRLRELWDEALAIPGAVGLAVATRPDCLPDDVLDLLSEYNGKTFLWVELGLQTSKEETARLINRCYPSEVYDEACLKLKARGIRTVTHLILGLPGETKEDMLASARHVFSFDPYGIKLHMLHVMKDTPLAEMYPDRCPLMSMDEYVSLVCDILEETPQSVTIHRLTGDAPKELLIAPDWTRNKHAVLNAIQREFKARGTRQGIRLEMSEQ
ncbi:MAG: TIGR01212 family radical SAM protein [Firmicutes bacterium]|nr:TIGR01212 family radical SAM protein [Bacillota bacterium]